MPEKKLPKLLVIDNYDSFTYNLVQMFLGYDIEVHVFRSDEITEKDAEKLSPDYLLISPGPKDPSHAGISIPLIRKYYKKIPVLGVCLGMQCINELFGGSTEKVDLPVHGKTSRIDHGGVGVFKGIPEKFTAARYHSLAIEPSDSELEITAMSDDGVVMGIKHRNFPLHGVQFHPESFMTEHGDAMIRNFLDDGPL